MRVHRIFGATVAAALLSLAAAASAGPPWLSVELPANPHHPSTRGAAFLVHAYHHGDAVSAAVTARIEGLVKGERRTLPLVVEATERSGVYAVRGDVPKGGAWIAVITLGEGAKSAAHAVVRLDGEGRVASVDVPSDRTADGWTVPRPLRAGEIDAALEEAARIAARDSWLAGGTALAGLGVLPLLALVGIARARRRD
jgi:hypothetical protein